MFFFYFFYDRFAWGEPRDKHGRVDKHLIHYFEPYIS